jgi:predicted Zn-dependent protease
VAEFHALSPDRGLPPMTAPAADAWAAADALAAEIRARFAPASLAADANDPDVRAVTTESPESLAAYAAGLEALTLANDPATAATQFQRAWAQDPDFTLAGYGHFLALGQLGRNEEAQANLRQLLPRMHRLPERQRFWLQVTATPDPQRKRVIYEAWRRKLPEDPEPKLALARFALAENPGDATALATMTELMLEDDRPVAHAQVADLHRRRGDVDTAESLLREGLARHPAEGLLTAPLAELLANTGRHDEARALLEEWAQLRPDLVSPWVQLSLLHVNQGRPAEALAAADQAEAQASNPGARRVALEHRAFLLFALGRTRQGLALLPGLLEMQQADAQATPLVYRHHLRYLAPHAQVHGREAALAWLRAATPAGLDPAIADYLRTAAETLVASTLADADGLATAIAARRAALASFDSNVSRQDRLLTDRYEAEGLHLSGQSADALARFRALEPAWRKAYAEGQASEPAGDNFYLPALDAATAAGDLAQARQWLALLEKSEPSDPNTLLARARLLAAEGDTAGARASLARALATWADADPDFRPAREARALAQRLAAGG